MKTKALLITLGFGLTTAAICLAGDEQTLRDLDAQWSKAAGAKDLDKTVSYYASDAVVMPPHAAAATTKEAMRKSWSDLISIPGMSISWKPTKAEIAKSGDLAYTSGTYELTMNDASGKPITDHGKYLEVWKKQADDSWKCALDIWNSDLPEASAEKKYISSRCVHSRRS